MATSNHLISGPSGRGGRTGTTGLFRKLVLCGFAVLLVMFSVAQVQAGRVLELSLAERFSGRTISLAGDDLDLADIFLFISLNTGVDILVDNNITGTVSFHFQDSSLNTVFCALLNIAGARCVDRQGVAFVFKDQHDRSGLPRRFSTRLCPQYQSGAEIFASMRAWYGYGEDLVLEEGSGCLLISGTPQHVLKARDIFKELDRPAALFCIDVRLLQIDSATLYDLPIEWVVGEEPDAGVGADVPDSAETFAKPEKQFLVGELVVNPEEGSILEEAPEKRQHLVTEQKMVIAVDKSSAMRLGAEDFGEPAAAADYLLEVTPGLQQFRNGYIVVGLSRQTVPVEMPRDFVVPGGNFSLKVTGHNSLVLMPAPLPQRESDNAGVHRELVNPDTAARGDDHAVAAQEPAEAVEDYVTMILVSPRIVYSNESCVEEYRKLDGSCDDGDVPVPGMAPRLSSATRRIITVGPLRERERYQL